jgi:hypothetical protein
MKPRIRKTPRGWSCEGVWGRTPKQAFRAWYRKRPFEAAEFETARAVLKAIAANSGRPVYAKNGKYYSREEFLALGRDG